MNGQRIAVSSAVTTYEGSVVVNGMRLEAPFAFQAIGNSDTLDRALGRKGGMVSYLADHVPRGRDHADQEAGDDALDVQRGAEARERGGREVAAGELSGARRSRSCHPSSLHSQPPPTLATWPLSPFLNAAKVDTSRRASLPQSGQAVGWLAADMLQQLIELHPTAVATVLVNGHGTTSMHSSRQSPDAIQGRTAAGAVSTAAVAAIVQC